MDEMFIETKAQEYKTALKQAQDDLAERKRAEGSRQEHAPRLWQMIRMELESGVDQFNKLFPSTIPMSYSSPTVDSAELALDWAPTRRTLSLRYDAEKLIVAWTLDGSERQEASVVVVDREVCLATRTQKKLNVVALSTAIFSSFVPTRRRGT